MIDTSSLLFGGCRCEGEGLLSWTLMKLAGTKYVGCLERRLRRQGSTVASDQDDT
jgi:hypothetical protein